MSLSSPGCSALQGADTVIYERLDPKNAVNAELRGITREHMEGFGAAGLRTLCLACAELDPDLYDACARRSPLRRAGPHVGRRQPSLAACAYCVWSLLPML